MKCYSFIQCTKFNSGQDKNNGNNSERQSVEEGYMNDLMNPWENFYLHTRNDKKGYSCRWLSSTFSSKMKKC